MEIGNLVQIVFIGLLRGGIYALMAASLALLFGVMGVASFVQGDLAMLGAYIGYIIISSLGLDPLLSILVVMVVLFLVGCGIEKSLFSPLRRLTGERWVLNTFVLTLGLSIILQNSVLIVAGPAYRGLPYLWEGSISLFGSTFSLDRLVILLISVMVISVFWAFLQKTKLGRAIRATSMNERAAAIHGINVNIIYVITVGLSCMLAGVAGVLLIPILTVYPTVGTLPLQRAWVITVISGLGNIKGSIYCSFLLGIIETIAYFTLSAGWQSVILFLAVVLVLLLRPSGLFRKEVKGIWEK
jgi:branched-chain amino acid transport system permease protein